MNCEIDLCRVDVIILRQVERKTHGYPMNRYFAEDEENLLCTLSKIPSLECLYFFGMDFSFNFPHWFLELTGSSELTHITIYQLSTS